MNIFVIVPIVPDPKGEANQAVSFELLTFLSGKGHKIILQPILADSNYSQRANDQDSTSTAKNKINELGVDILDTIFVDKQEEKNNSKLIKYLKNLLFILNIIVFRSRINPKIFPAIKLSEKIRDIIYSKNSDIILSIWSWEAVPATNLINDIPKFAYYGNPDHKPERMRLNFPELFDIRKEGFKNSLYYFLTKARNKTKEIQHLKMMMKNDIIATDAQNHAIYYAKHGHKNSIYINNLWPISKNKPIFGGIAKKNKPIKIVGSVGNLAATGNTFGLHYLGNRVAPLCEQNLGKGNIVFSIYGGGKLRKSNKSIAHNSTFNFKGWVEDLENEILTSYAFLVLSNAYGFSVGNTRVLLAWSLGSCLITHANSVKSMPILKNGENALLGENPEQIANLISKITYDHKLRKKIGKGGYDTFIKYFTAEHVSERILTEMYGLINKKL